MFYFIGISPSYVSNWLNSLPLESVAEFYLIRGPLGEQHCLMAMSGLTSSQLATQGVRATRLFLPLMPSSVPSCMLVEDGPVRLWPRPWCWARRSRKVCVGIWALILKKPTAPSTWAHKVRGRQTLGQGAVCLWAPAAQDGKTKNVHLHKWSLNLFLWCLFNADYNLKKEKLQFKQGRGIRTSESSWVHQNA